MPFGRSSPLGRTSQTSLLGGPLCLSVNCLCLADRVAFGRPSLLGRTSVLGGPGCPLVDPRRCLAERHCKSLNSRRLAALRCSRVSLHCFPQWTSAARQNFAARQSSAFVAAARQNFASWQSSALVAAGPLLSGCCLSLRKGSLNC